MKNLPQRNKRRPAKSVGRAQAQAQAQATVAGRKRTTWFLLILFGLGSYFFGAKVSPLVEEYWIKEPARASGTGEVVVHTAKFADEEDSIPVAGSAPEYDKEPEEKNKAVKSSTGSIFSEGDPPLIVGNVPEGWRVETSNEIKIKFGPRKVPLGDDITFVVPVYTLVPSDNLDGVYIIEPGRTKTGDDEGGTLSAILSRLDGEIGAISVALGSLSKALTMLPAQEEVGVVEEGIIYKTSVSGR